HNLQRIAFVACRRAESVYFAIDFRPMPSRNIDELPASHFQKHWRFGGFAMREPVEVVEAIVTDCNLPNRTDGFETGETLCRNLPKQARLWPKRNDGIGCAT